MRLGGFGGRIKAMVPRNDTKAQRRAKEYYLKALSKKMVFLASLAERREIGDY
jgi:hypothetical protein